MNPMTEILKLHAIYNQFTGFNLSMRYDRERSWYEFLKAGFTIEDLRLVLIYLKRQIKADKRHSGSLRFSNLIECLNMFEEERELARNQSLRTGPPETNRQSVIRVFRPQIPDATGPTVQCKPVSSIVPDLIKALKEAAK